MIEREGESGLGGVERGDNLTQGALAFSPKRKGIERTIPFLGVKGAWCIQFWLLGDPRHPRPYTGYPVTRVGGVVVVALSRSASLSLSRLMADSPSEERRA